MILANPKPNLIFTNLALALGSPEGLWPMPSNILYKDWKEKAVHDRCWYWIYIDRHRINVRCHWIGWICLGEYPCTLQLIGRKEFTQKKSCCWPLYMMIIHRGFCGGVEYRWEPDDDHMPIWDCSDHRHDIWHLRLVDQPRVVFVVELERPLQLLLCGLCWQQLERLVVAMFMRVGGVRQSSLDHSFQHILLITWLNSLKSR